MNLKVRDLTKHTKEETLNTGVYAIVNLLDNKFYLGSAAYCLEIESQKGFYRRWYQHFYRLNKGIHHCIYLQRAWTKYGAENFEFRILEVVEPNFCIETEQNYLDLSDHTLLYNMCKVAGSSLGTTRSPEFCSIKTKEFELIDPEGKLVQCKNMSEFCRTNGLQQASLNAVLRGDQLHHQGWTKDPASYKIYKKAYDLRGISYRPRFGGLYEITIDRKFYGAFKNLEEAKIERNNLETLLGKNINPKGFKNWKDLVNQERLEEF
jgi:hypothetical protein